MVNFPVTFDDGILMVDLNMGDGTFAKECFRRNVAMYYGFEDRDDLFVEAENNLVDFRDYCKIYKQRICRSDKFDDVDATRFDFIISHLPPVDVLKISCGKELYPILMTSKYLNKIGSIIGTIDKPTRSQNASKTSSDYSVGQILQPKMSDLKKYLEINGFNVEVSKDNKKFVAYKNGAMTFTLSTTTVLSSGLSNTPK